MQVKKGDRSKGTISVTPTSHPTSHVDVASGNTDNLVPSICERESGSIALSRKRSNRVVLHGKVDISYLHKVALVSVAADEHYATVDCI